MPEIESRGFDRFDRWRSWLSDEGHDCIVLKVPPLQEEFTPSGYWIGIHGDHAAIKRGSGGHHRRHARPPRTGRGNHREHADARRRLSRTEPVWDPWGIETEDDAHGELLAGLVLLPIDERE